MLPAIPRSSSARSPNTKDGMATLNRTNSQSSVPNSFGLDSNSAAAPADNNRGGAVGSLDGVTPGGRAAAAGNGCAAAKANRENRQGSANPCFNKSRQSSGGDLNPTSRATTTTHTSASLATPSAKQEGRLPNAYTIVGATREGDGLLCTDSLSSVAAHSLEKGPPAEKVEILDSGSVHLLQQMQQLLHDGVSAEAMQQWIAGQLHRAAQTSTKASCETFLVTAPSIDPSSFPLGGTVPEHGGSDAPTTPGNPRCPAPVVPIPLVSTYLGSQPLSNRASPLPSANAVVASPVTVEQGGMSDGDVALEPTPPVLPPPSPASLAATRAANRTAMMASPPLTADNAPLRDDNTTVVVGDDAYLNSSNRGFPTTTATNVHSNITPSTPPKRGHGPLYKGSGVGTSAALSVAVNNNTTTEEGGNPSKVDAPAAGAAGRRGSLSVVFPSATMNSSASAPVVNAGAGGGLLKTPRTNTSGKYQHGQQWRSYSRGTSADKVVASVRRAQESSLHEVTKVAIQATTSRVVADDQRTIGLVLGEYFSRNPESMVRRLATPPASVSTTLTMTTVPEGRRHSSCSAGDSCLPSALCERAEQFVTSPQGRSSAVTKGVAAVPLGMGSNFDPVCGSGPLPYHSQPHAAGDVAHEQQQQQQHRGVEQRNGEPFSKGDGSTAAPAVSDRSTPIDHSTASNSRAPTPQSMTPLAAGFTGNRSHRSSGVSLLNTSSFVSRRQQRSQQSSESAPTLPNSVPGTAGTLTCEQDALFPQHSLLVSPAVSPVARAAAAAKAMGQRFDNPRSLSPSSAVVAVTSSSVLDAALPSTAEGKEDSKSPVAGSAKRTTLANIIPLIEVTCEGDESGSVTPITADSSSNTSCSKGILHYYNSHTNISSGLAAVSTAGAAAPAGGSDVMAGKGVPRAWGMAAVSNNGGTANSANNNNYYTTTSTTTAAGTLPPVNTSVTSFTWMQSSTSMTNDNFSGCSPLTASSGGTLGFHHGQHHHRSVQPGGRVASFASNTSSHLGVGYNNSNNYNNNLNGFGASHANYPEGRSFLSLGDDMQSFDSSRISCVSGGRDGALTGADNRLHCSSVLHLSHASINGGIDPLMDGVMPAFVLDGASAAARRPGPRFQRTYCRHSPVHLPEEVTRQLLEELDVLYLPHIDEAANPSMVLNLMDVHGYRDARTFYVVMCLNVVLRYNLVRRFAWSTKKLKRFFEVAATFFRDGNPFHNVVNATDIVLGAHQWLSEGTTAAALSDDEVAAFLLSAITLQITHTGVDNRLMTQMKHPYAMLCSFTSPQQGALVALVMALLRDPELRFFPNPNTTAANVNATPTHPATNITLANVVHDWTSDRETQLCDMLSELVMATDLRNHSVLQRGIQHMAEENAQRHGCLCAGASLSKPLSPSRTSRSGRGRSYTPLGVTPIKAQGSEGSGSCGAGASPLTRGDNSNSNNRTNSAGGHHICQNCCAYVTENHVADLLKGVLHFLNFPFLCRSYENYITGAIRYVAEMYRQSGVEYRILRQQQQIQQQRLLLQQETAAEDSRSSHRNVGSPLPVVADTPHSVVENTFSIRLDAAQQAPPPPQGGDLENSAATFATVAMEERQPWGQHMNQVSTVASLQRCQSTEMESASLSRKHTTTTLAHSTSGCTPLLEDSADLPHSGSDDVASTDTAAPRKQPPVLPLLGHGRDIMLIAVEDVSLPFVEVFAPYMPEAWVRATYLNHQTFTVTMPASEEFDKAVLRVLNLAEETEDDIVKRLEEDAGSKDVMSAVKWLLLRRICPSSPEWTVNKDGVARRVVKEVVSRTEHLLDMCEV